MTGPFDRWDRHVNNWYGLPNPPLPADPHMAWSAYCLIDMHWWCENPAECGCDQCNHRQRVDDDQTWGPLDQEQT